jgi:holo-[acyl-carrier protein] synthase
MNNLIGLGIDIVEINRIKKALNKNNNFKTRIFSKKEINFCEKNKNKFSCYSKRFAAKEAFSKALGTGIAKGLNFNEIVVIKNKLGKPSIELYGKSLAVTRKITKKNKIKIFLSLSDEKKYATASVVLTL